MIYDTPAIDYWRATTNEMIKMDELIAELMPRKEEGEEGRFLQYEGTRYGPLFMGSAMQGSKRNYLLELSGEAADDMFERLIYSDMKMTRLDLQFTVKKPEDWDTVEFHFAMELGEWPNGIVRDVQTRLNKGDDTIYIGDRTGQRYIRVYVKDTNFIRFEVEFKKEAAVSAWKLVKNGRRHAIAGILLAEIQSVPYAPILGQMTESLKKHTDVTIKVPIYRKETTNLGKLKWLRSLMPTIRKMMNDHDYGHIVSKWIMQLADEHLLKGERENEQQ